MGIKIALAGNPNSGKTTLFNALTGSNQFVGNWPGVTVEKKEGKMKQRDDVILTDLPGIYSLSPYTLEEVVARDYLIEERPDVILNIVDGTNLERNLYLTTQLMELGIPIVLAINMIDVVRKIGDKIDIAELGRKLGCKIVEISALKGTGIEEAAQAAISSAGGAAPLQRHIFSGVVEHALAHIEEGTFLHDMPEEKQRWYSIKIFERDEKVLEQLNIPKKKLEHIERDIQRAELELDDDSESIITNERYVYIGKLLQNCYKRKSNRFTISDNIDKVVTNRFLALPVFALVMFIVYFVSITLVGSVVTEWFNNIWTSTVPALAEQGLSAINCAEWLKSLVVDGIIGGVGSVLSFLPQILTLFIFLAFLEACGYMSRIAFVLDKIFRKFGLSGKSFIPMLVGTGCGVPGIMASRTIENERDRRMTIITTTFIPCGAKLPVIAMISSALFGGAWWVAPSAYFLGIAAIVISGIMLKKTKMFAGNPAPFVMELPAYHMPTPINVLRSMWDRGWSFIKKAGTVILLFSILIWAGSKFGWYGTSFGFNADLELENSILGAIGSGIKWIFAPLGFGESRAAIATIMGLAAKEEIVGVFGVIDIAGLSALAGYSFLAFNLLCAPCVAAIAAIRREMNSAGWTLFAVGYQCVLAYAVSLVIYQIGSAFTGNLNAVGLIFAVAVIAFVIYMLARPYKEADGLKVKIKR